MKKIFYTLSLCIALQSANAQTYLIENFNYVSNDSLLNNGWVLANSTVNPLRASATGLSYSGYSSSGIGNAVPMANNGQDVVKDASVPLTSGSVYSSFLMNVSAAQAAGDYFFGLVTPASTTAFYARVFIKSTVTAGYYNIGVSKYSVGAAETAVYSTDSFTLSTTYLCVVKYQYNTSTTTDDSVKVFMFSSGIPAAEPAVGKAATIGGTNVDATSLQRILLRQGSATNAATLTVDGIRFGPSWGDVALPVNLTHFSASKLNNDITLNWTTASEINNDRFVIERSTDNTIFESIGEVKGAGNSTKTLNYSFVDESINAGKILYYRLKQVDVDGNFTYSKTVCVIVDINSQIITTPNPFTNDITIHIDAKNNSNAIVEVVDLLGKVHYSGSQKVNAGDNSIPVNTSAMSDGIYFVRMNIDGELFTQKIIKR